VVVQSDAGSAGAQCHRHAGGGGTGQWSEHGGTQESRQKIGDPAQRGSSPVRAFTR
jgi:hypothetical protein